MREQAIIFANTNGFSGDFVRYIALASIKDVREFLRANGQLA